MKTDAIDRKETAKWPGRRHLSGFMSVVLTLMNILLAVVTIFSAYGGRIDPATTCVGAMAAMVFPGFLVITIVVLTINLVWFRRRSLINLFSLLVCFGPIQTICPLNFFRPSIASIESSGERTLKVITFNTLNFETFVDFYDSNAISDSGNPTFEYILDQDADIVVCQEATDIVKAELHGVTTRQHTALMQRYPYHDVTRRGMAILSKYPFKSVEVDVADRNQLDLLRYDVAIDGDTLHLFNVHMQSIGLTSGDKEMYRNLTHGDAPQQLEDIRQTLVAKLTAAFRSRALQAEDVRRALDNVEGMVMLCGDFNDIPGSYAARCIAGSDMTDAYRAAGLGPSITYHADRLYFRIDHIFYRGPLKALRVWRGDCRSSDHYPLEGIFKIE